MFEKFLQTPECMKILSWMLNHPNGEYSADIIGMECGMVSIPDYMAAITVLEGAGFIIIDELSEKITLKLNKEASIVQLLTHLKDEFNDNAFRSEYISPSLAYLHSDQIKKIIDSEIFKEVNPADIIEMCKNYKELDLSNKKNQDIYNLCSSLEATGEYEDFIYKLENGLKK